MEQQALIINYQYCTGCHVCEVACRNEHGIPLDEWGIKLTEFGPKKLDGKWYYDYVPVPSTLCDFCADRQAEGLDPACVHHCLALCMEVAPLSKVGERLAELGEGSTAFVPR